MLESLETADVEWQILVSTVMLSRDLFGSMHYIVENLKLLKLISELTVSQIAGRQAFLFVYYYWSRFLLLFTCLWNRQLKLE